MAEEGLKESEEKFRNLLETAVDPIIILDKKGTFVSINNKVTELTGFTKKDLIGKHFTKVKILTSKSKIICLKKFVKRMLGKYIPPYEIEALTKKGNIISVELNANPIKEKGKIVGDLVILRDITKRKEVEEVLRKNEEKYRRLFEGANDMIQSVGPDGMFVDVNPKWCEVMGYTKEEALKMNLMNIIHPRSQQHCMELFKKTMSGKSVKDIKAEFVTKKGKVIIVNGSASYILESGKPSVTWGIFRDITKRKEMEKQIFDSNKRLQRAAQELKVAIETKGEFMNIAAHELRTPLQPIIGYADRLLQEGNSTNWQKERLNIILDNAKNLLKLVQDVLDINKMETGIMKFSMKEADLLKIIKEVYDSFKPAVEERGLKFILDLPKISGEIKIKGDPGRVTQVFANLIDNAVKFTDKGIIAIQVKENKDTAIISIKDTGIGIAKSDMPKVFTKFFQADATDKRKRGGTGLGLAICKQIVKAHQGKISAQSTLGKGSTFQVILPKLVRSS